MLKADPRNIGFCLYVNFFNELGDQPGEIFIGYCRPVATYTKASRKAVTAVDGLFYAKIEEATRQIAC